MSLEVFSSRLIPALLSQFAKSLSIKDRTHFTWKVKCKEGSYNTHRLSQTTNSTVFLETCYSETHLDEGLSKMTSIFASADIATLVANFPPPNAPSGRPLLLRSRSGDGLITFEALVERLEELLKTSESRIEKAKLATFLGVEDGSQRQVYESLDAPLYESRDGRHFMPEPETKSILANLEAQAAKKCVDLGKFALENDLKDESVLDLIDHNLSSETSRLFEDQAFCSIDVADDIKTKLRDAIGSAGSDICDLPAAVSDEVPMVTLRELSAELSIELGGNIRLEGDHVVYVPANYSAAVEARMKQMRDERVQELVKQVEEREWVVVSPDEDEQGGADEEEDTAELVMITYGEKYERDLQMIILQADTPRTGKRSKWQSENRLLLTSKALNQELNAMRSAVTCHTKSLWQKSERPSPSTIVKNLTPNDFSKSHDPELAKLLFRSEHVKDIEDAVRDQVEQLEREEHEKLVQLVEIRLIIPLQLYAAGTDSIKDVTLKQQLEEFVADHFRREVIPQMIKAAKEQNLLRDKARSKEVERLQQACTEGTTFATLQITVAKFSKKLKIETPSEDLVKKVWARTLQAAAKSMQKMTRGSDMLQNLIWILLAQKSDGLYMSSGKNTSRMIKQYQAVADDETAKKLTMWRDMLKAGQETKEDVQEMRELAKTAVDEIAGPERKSSISPEGRKASISSCSPMGRRKSSGSAQPAEWQP